MNRSVSLTNTARMREYITERRAHWNKQAQSELRWSHAAVTYRKLVQQIYENIVEPGARVLELGCGEGDLLQSLKPSTGLGVDLSDVRIDKAKHKHSDITFINADVHDLSEIYGTFDYILLSDLLPDLYDVRGVLGQLSDLSHRRTRIIINYFSHLWSLPLTFARRVGFASRTLRQNWLTKEDVNNLLYISDLELVSVWDEILIPLQVPLISTFANKVLSKIWPIQHLSLTHVMVARVNPQLFEKQSYGVSVIVPTRNESGNIKNILDRVPTIGNETEVIFVEGGSTDGTFEAIQAQLQLGTRLPTRLFRQTGDGKGDAVRLGFEQAKHEVLMILDADLTMPPEELPQFYDLLVDGKGDFINGVRLVYPMQDRAMRFMNLVGNKFFSLGFSYVLGQQIKDTLCGTKVLFRADYRAIERNRSYFGDFDPFGDFDLIFGAARKRMKIVDLPIRYHARAYGDTNINRWSAGWMLLKMLAIGMKKLKFV